jgi:hypothetical protein
MIRGTNGISARQSFCIPLDCEEGFPGDRDARQENLLICGTKRISTRQSFRNPFNSEEHIQ